MGHCAHFLKHLDERAHQEGLWPGALMVPMVVPLRAPTGLQLCQGDPGPNTVEVAKFVTVYVNSPWGGSSISQSMFWVC